MKSAINWFEIPVRDMDRAVRFYGGVLGIEFKREEFGGREIAVFPAEDPGVGGALVAEKHRQPSMDGALVYLDATGQLDACLARVVPAGGEIILPRTSVGDPGFIALVRDPEGNCVGLHSPPVG
jgi:hypothetical protein